MRNVSLSKINVLNVTRMLKRKGGKVGKRVDQPYQNLTPHVIRWSNDA